MLCRASNAGWAGSWESMDRETTRSCMRGQPQETGATLIDDVALARAIHVIAVVFWIGGVAMVTTVLLAAVRRFKSPNERVAFFESVEHRFARQARLSTLITGLSGFYMMYRFNLWGRFESGSFWGVDGVGGVWAAFHL